MIKKTDVLTYFNCYYFISEREKVKVRKKEGNRQKERETEIDRQRETGRGELNEQASERR